jgi:hypothetical protein
MKIWTFAGVVVLVACLPSSWSTKACAGPFDELIAHLPSECNVVMGADVQSLVRSPLGVERKWADKIKQDFQSGMCLTPPTAMRFVIGTSYDYASLQPRWRVKVNKLSVEVTPEKIAQRMGGQVDNVAGVPVVVCPKEHLIVQYSPTMAGEVIGVQRQELARWLRSGLHTREASPLSPYLRQAIEGIAGGTQVVMAFDLEDVFHSEGLQEKLRGCKTVADTKADVNKLVKTLAGLKGARVQMGVTDDIRGEIYLDFAEPPLALQGVGQKLILEVLQHIGAEIEDLKNWNPAVEGNSFVMRGKLAPASARLLLSPVDNRAGQQAYIDNPSQRVGTLDNTGMATVQYYRSVIALLQDIEPGATSKANSTDRRTFYYKQYAEKIDSLPILDVDPQVLKYGQAVSITLRNLSGLSRVTKAQYENNMAQYQQGFAMNSYGGYYGGYGAYGGAYGGGWSYSTYTPSAVNVDNSMDVRNMMASTAQNSQALREQTWQNIKMANQQIRKYLVDKYKVEV